VKTHTRVVIIGGGVVGAGCGTPLPPRARGHASAEDHPVGLTTGGAVCHKVGQSLAFGYVEPTLARPGELFEVLMMGERVVARVLTEPAWDPQSLRIRADARR
jgi:glycine cleavage system aminomethyltransferase T